MKTIRELPPVEQLRSRTLGRILIKMGVLTREKVHECLKIQKQRPGKKIGEIFLELGLVEEKELFIALAAQRGMEYVDLKEVDIPPDVIEKVPAQMAKTYHIVPFQFNEAQNELLVVLDNPDNFRATDDLSTLMGFKVIAKIADHEVLEGILNKYYEGKEEKEGINELIGEIQEDGFLAEFAG
ncbi:MAG: GspE/PulE/PilB domain-containing protein, partial [Planctomycetota bacterium]